MPNHLKRLIGSGQCLVNKPVSVDERSFVQRVQRTRQVDKCGRIGIRPRFGRLSERSDHCAAGLAAFVGLEAGHYKCPFSVRPCPRLRRVGFKVVIQGFTRGASCNLFVMPKPLFKNRVDPNKAYIYQVFIKRIHVEEIQKRQDKNDTYKKSTCAHLERLHQTRHTPNDAAVIFNKKII
ncbi:MAG: hypothetical protein EPN46_10085 [Candidimonas sp.]|nr:MAG: hypothetical protein EPN62_09790 [Candidimonas sp.]TAM75737.1 MAG: hypothetical protein EPN46_10085 [Candidimonas sp.]